MSLSKRKDRGKKLQNCCTPLFLFVPHALLSTTHTLPTLWKHTSVPFLLGSTKQRCPAPPVTSSNECHPARDVHPLQNVIGHRSIVHPVRTWEKPNLFGNK